MHLSNSDREPEKLDLYKLHKSEYVTPKKPSLIQTAPAHYLSIRGKGAPGCERFATCIGALYSVAFTIKMKRKFAGKQDYAVCKLEAQWFVDGVPVSIPKEKWRWKLLIRTPEFISTADCAAAAATLLKKGKPREVEEVTIEKLDEGQCVQMLHVGPYERENGAIEVMRNFASAKGLAFKGPHHEIYLSDPRRVPPEKLKTILRQPVGDE